MRDLIRRVRYLLRRSHLDADLREEMETHRLLRQAQLEREGMPPDAAERASRLRFGQAAIARDDVGDVWAGRLDVWRQDVRHALKTLVTRPGFALTAIVTLALCVGANLVVFTIVNALWLRPRAISEPERVVMVHGPSDSGLLEGTGFGVRWIERAAAIPEVEFVALQARTSHEYADNLPHIRFPTVPREVETVAVTGQYFPVMGLTIRGRDFVGADDLPGAAPVGIISDSLWLQAFRRSPEVIGTEIESSPIRLRIIGIAPPGFHGARLGEQTDLWIPRHLVPQVAKPGMGDRDPSNLLFLRLRPGVTAGDAERRVNEVRSPEGRPGYRVIPVGRLYGGPASRTIFVGQHGVVSIAAAASTLVLLAGCATLMALVLVHYERRRQELAIRMALGSSRRRLVRALVMELAPPAGLALVAAVALAWAILRALPSLSLPGGIELGRLNLSVDAAVVVWGAIVTGLAIVVAAALPLRRSTRPTLAGELVTVSSRTTASSHALRSIVLATHVAATIVVLVGAGVFVETVRQGFTEGPGFDANRLLFAEFKFRPSGTSLLLTDAGEADAQVRRSVELSRVLDTISSHPGVSGVAIGRAPVGIEQTADLEFPRELVTSGEAREVRVSFMNVAPAYREALGLSLLAGRDLRDDDVRDNYRVVADHPVLVTEAFCAVMWPGLSPLAQRFSFPGARYTLVVVGVVGDFPVGSQRLGSRAAVLAATEVLKAARPQVLAFAVRTAADPGLLVEPVRRAILDVFPNAPTVNVRTGRDVIAEDLGRERLGAWFFSGFGLVALALGIGGVFGLVAYLAESRRREIGVRLALGAQHGQIARLLVGAGVRPVAAGTAAGLIAAALLVRIVDAVALGARQLDASAFAIAAALMLGGTVAAGVTAAWRARSIAPSEALRSE